jgi:transcriptional regulator with XRE-family HTH domain
LGLSQRDLAKLAKLDVTTINRLESFAADEIRGKSETIKALVTALERQGCELTETGVQLIRKARR